MANPWFPFYVDDYERKTSHLTLLQRGAYSELMRRYYMIGGPLPAIAEQVHRMCRAVDDTERSAIAYCLTSFFRLDDDGYHHDRCDEEIAKSREISEKRSKSASSRHSKNDANAPASADANAMQLQTQLQPQLHIKTNPPPNPLKEGERVKEVSRKRRSRKVVPSGYSPEVEEIVNAVGLQWPKIQPGDGKAINLDVPQFAARVDALLREGVSRTLLESSALLYLQQKKQYYTAAHFFFGPGNNQSANWKLYSQMVEHQQQGATV